MVDDVDFDLTAAMTEVVTETSALPIDDDTAPETPYPTRLNSTTESIALVAACCGIGVVLASHGRGIDCMIDGCGRSLADLGLDDAPDGLSIWEGTSVATMPWDSFIDEDVELVGVFRQLTEDEWVLVRATGVPWAFAGDVDKDPPDLADMTRIMANITKGHGITIPLTSMNQSPSPLSITEEERIVVGVVIEPEGGTNVH